MLGVSTPPKIPQNWPAKFPAQKVGNFLC